MKSFCHHCGSGLLPDAAFCHVCGGAVPREMRGETQITPHVRAAAFVRMGNVTDAIAAYTAIIAQQPSDPEAYVALAALRLATRETVAAEALLREALDRDETHAVAWAYLGALLLERAAVDKSEDAFLRALQHGPDQFLVRLKRGEAHLRLGRTYDAVEELALAVMLAAPDVQAASYARTLLVTARQQASRSVARTVGSVGKAQPRWFVRGRVARRWPAQTEEVIA